MDKKSLALPVLLIALGTGWMLTVLGVSPEINWAWSLGLAAVGVLTFAISGLDKVTAVVGSFLLVASCLSVLRQAGRLSTELEIPLLVISSGLLLLIARHRSIPAPKWLLAESNQADAAQALNNSMER